MIKNVGLKVHKDKAQYLIKKINFDSDLKIHETIFIFLINIYKIIFMKFTRLIQLSIFINYRNFNYLNFYI